MCDEHLADGQFFRDQEEELLEAASYDSYDAAEMQAEYELWNSLAEEALRDIEL